MKKLVLIVSAMFLLVIMAYSSGETAGNLKYPILYPFCKNGKCGYIDKTGKVVVPPKFASAEDFSEGLGLISVKNPQKGQYCNLYGFIDETGNFIIKPSRYDLAGNFHDGLARVTMGDRSGFVDRKGSLVIPLVIGEGPRAIPWGVSDFSDGLAEKLVLSERESVFIDKKGRTVGPTNLTYEGNDFQIYDPGFTEGFAVIGGANKNKKWVYGYIDKKWRVVIKPRFEAAKPFHEGFAAVTVNGKDGFINTSGDIVINPVYDYASHFSEGFASVSMNGGYGFIDKKGNMVIQPIYQSSGLFSEGLAAVSVKDKHGYINGTGEMVIKPQFFGAREFKGGVAWVSVIGSDCYYINTKGEYICQKKNK